MKPRPWAEALLWLLLALVLLFLLGVCWDLVREALSLVQQGVAPRGVRIFFLAIIIGAGAILFIFRRRHRATYGLLELLFAFGAGWHWLEATKQGSVGDWAAGIAIIYVVVRGAVNVDQGLAKRRRPNQTLQ